MIAFNRLPTISNTSVQRTYCFDDLVRTNQPETSNCSQILWTLLGISTFEQSIKQKHYFEISPALLFVVIPRTLHQLLNEPND